MSKKTKTVLFIFLSIVVGLDTLAITCKEAMTIRAQGRRARWNRLADMLSAARDHSAREHSKRLVNWDRMIGVVYSPDSIAYAFRLRKALERERTEFGVFLLGSASRLVELANDHVNRGNARTAVIVTRSLKDYWEVIDIFTGDLHYE